MLTRLAHTPYMVIIAVSTGKKDLKTAANPTDAELKRAKTPTKHFSNHRKKKLNSTFRSSNLLKKKTTVEKPDV